LLHNLSKAEFSSMFAETFAATLSETLETGKTLGPQLASAPASKYSLGGSRQGHELNQVMKLIHVGTKTLRNEREVFVVHGEGNYDTHQDHKDDTAKALEAMMQPLDSFVKELKLHNLWSKLNSCYLCSKLSVFVQLFLCFTLFDTLECN